MFHHRNRILAAALALAAPLLFAACAASADYGQDGSELGEAPPPAPYAKVSELVELPEFIPGLGIMYVAPETLPAGPFLAYDRDGQLSATIYMTPLDALEQGTTYNDLAIGDTEVESVDVYHNAGHPGVEKPHVHVVLFHDEGARERLSE